MEKYEKLFKGLEMCAGPDCNPECPYHGETRGGKTCRAWLLNDAAAALAVEEHGAQKKPEPGLDEVMDTALKATMQAEYWRGQADALKDFLHFYCGGQTVEGMSLDLPDMHGEPEPEDDGHV